MVSERLSKSQQYLPPCWPFGYQSKASGADMEFLVLNGTDSESSLPQCPAHGQRKRSDFFERTSYPNWSSRNANVKLHVRKKGQRRDVPWALSEGFPSNVPDLEKSSTLATTSSKHEDDDRDGKQRTSSNDTKRVLETPDPVVARCQMPTSENMYSYPASSFAR